MIELETGTVTYRLFGEMMAGLSGRFTDARGACVADSRSAVGCEHLWGNASTGRDTRAAGAVLDTTTTVLGFDISGPASTRAMLYAQLGVVDSAFSRLRSAVRAKDPGPYAVAIFHA